MISCKKIVRITFSITIISLSVLVCLRIGGVESIWQDLSLAIVGSSFLSCVTAQISYNLERTKIRRTLIAKLILMQLEIKTILFEYCKTLDFWDQNDFFETNYSLRKSTREYYSYYETIRLETGEELSKFIKVESFNEIYGLYDFLRREIQEIGIYLKNREREKAFEKHKQCRDLNKKVVEKLVLLLEQEYGTNFAKINSIGLT